jgi:hypothetical protein
MGMRLGSLFIRLQMSLGKPASKFRFRAFETACSGSDFLASPFRQPAIL